MDKDILKGLKIGFGIIISLSLFLGIIFAVGFHNASEIVGGMFQGNFTFNGTINFSNAVVVGIREQYISASGGTITYDGDYTIHTFTSNGTFTVTSGWDTTYGDKVEYLIVAGGSGGGGNVGGGGGGGGRLSDTGGGNGPSSPPGTGTDGGGNGGGLSQNGYAGSANRGGGGERGLTGGTGGSGVIIIKYKSQ